MRTLALIVLAGCAKDAPPSWHVGNGALRAPDGRAVILRGANLGDQKNAPYLDTKTATDYQNLRDVWSMNAIRFVMTWAAVEPTAGTYDDAYLDGVIERLEWASASNLSVVIDMHEDVFGEGFGFDGAPDWACDASRYAAFVPQDPWFLDTQDPNVMACTDDFYTMTDRQQHFVDAWHHVAERLAGEPAVIGFDALNEPAWGTYPIFQFEKDRLGPLYAQVVTAVRSAAPEWIAFLEPGGSRNLGIATGFITPFPFPNVMYSPHSYDSSAESGNGFDPTHRAKILESVGELAGEAQALNAGLWIGEYGGMTTTSGITDYMTAQYDAAGMYAGSTMYWSYSTGDYGMMADDNTAKPVLLDVLVRPYPELVSGDPMMYAFDAPSSAFTFSYTPSGKLPTEIVVPDSIYPGGYSVDCGGCTFEKQANRLVIDTPGDGNVALAPM